MLSCACGLLSSGRPCYVRTSSEKRVRVISKQNALVAQLFTVGKKNENAIILYASRSYVSHVFINAHPL